MKEVPAERARPKSRILSVQSERTTILLGFKSLKHTKDRFRVNIVDATSCNEIYNTGIAKMFINSFEGTVSRDGFGF